MPWWHLILLKALRATAAADATASLLKVDTMC